MSYIIGPPLEQHFTYEVWFWSEENEKWVFDSPHESVAMAFQYADSLDMKTQVKRFTESVALVVKTDQ